MKPTIIDSHTHLKDTSSLDTHMALAKACGHASIGIACTIDPNTVNANPPAFACKAAYHDSVYVFAGLDHTSGEPSLELSDQVRQLNEIGVDGIKLIESKPTSRHHIEIPLDADYYRGFFTAVEDLRIPLLWHVADPEEFWDPELLPLWAQEQGWGYGDSDVTKEALYGEVDNVLQRHPDLRVTFAHFYFLSADLPRAADFLRRHPNVSFDLAPGVEMLYNLSKDPEKSRDFFVTHAKRIIYGTDMFSTLSEDEARTRSGMVRRWLETSEEFSISSDADSLIGKPGDGVIKGMALDDDTLRSIYAENFLNLVGNTPSPLDMELAIDECLRISDAANDGTEALAAAEAIRSRG